MTFPPLYKGFPAHLNNYDGKRLTIIPSNHLIIIQLTSIMMVNAILSLKKIVRVAFLSHEIHNIFQ